MDTDIIRRIVIKVIAQARGQLGDQGTTYHAMDNAGITSPWAPT